MQESTRHFLVCMQLIYCVWGQLGDQDKIFCVTGFTNKKLNFRSSYLSYGGNQKMM